MNVYRSDNPWGVPLLNPSLQAESLATPVLLWGSRSRESSNPGTWAHYVDDYRFTSLMGKPEMLVATGCAATTEINLTVYDNTPRAVALHAVYQKRLLAAKWQAHGIRIWVDLCVPAHYQDLNLLGVPRGWGAYSTRGFAARPHELVAEYETALDHAGRTPLLMVVGGGKSIARLCLDLPGSIYVPHEPKKRELANSNQMPATLSQHNSAAPFDPSEVHNG